MIKQIYKVFNHNGTFLGEFKTLAQAIKEQKYYTSQTGNFAYIQKVQK